MQTSPEASSEQRPGAQWWHFGLVWLPAVAAYAVLARWLTLAPLIDDYWHLLAFALQWEKAAGAAAKVKLIFTNQVGPYKLIFDHALIGLQLLLSGRLNFPVLILLGNLTLLGIAALLWRNTPREKPGKHWPLVLLPVSLLLFSLNYAETLDWAISGLQQPMVVMFSLASVHFLVKREGLVVDFVLACAFALLASATYANGVLVWIVGLLYLLLQGRRGGWRPARLTAWCLCAAAGFFPYLYRYHSSGITAKAGLWQQLVFFVSFCGGGMENMHHRPVPGVSVVLGVAIVATCVRALMTRYDLRSPFFFYSMLWLLFTAAVVANARVGMGMELSLSSRYKLYCDLLLVVCYEYGLDRWAKADEGRPRALKNYLALTTSAALVFCIGGDVAGSVFLSTRKQRAETAMHAYLAHPESASPMFLVEDVLSPDERAQEDLAREQLNEARRLGIYEPPKL